MTEVDVRDIRQFKAFVQRVVSQNEGGRELAIHLAARSVLRLVSIFSVETIIKRSSNIETIMLPWCRAVSLPWVAGSYPQHNYQLSDRSKKAGQINTDHIIDSRFIEIASLADDANRAVSIIRSTDFALDVSRTASFAASRSIYLLSSALRKDVKIVDSGESLMNRPLWLTATPRRVKVDWGFIKRELEERDEDWDVWTDWYDARLRGGPTHPDLSAAANERIEIARFVELDEGDWEQGPAHVNAKIKAIIERELEKGPPARPDDVRDELQTVVPEDRPASVRTRWDGEQQRVLLDKTPVDIDLEADSGVAELLALKDAIEALITRLSGMSTSNFDRDGIEVLRQTTSCMPASVPNSQELNILIIRETAHERYHSTVVEQWSGSLRAEYEAISIALTAALDLFPERRLRRRVDWSSKLEDLPASSVKSALTKANDTLKTDQGRAVVDTAITDIIDARTESLPDEGDMSDPIDRAVAVDGFESFHNTVKTMTRNAPDKIEVRDVLQEVDRVISEEADAFEEGVREGVRDGLRTAGRTAGLARISERAAVSVWDRLPGFDWFRSRRNK